MSCSATKESLRAAWSGNRPRELVFTVPEGNVVIDPRAGRDQGRALGGLVLIPRDQVAGRAWARLYPLWDRR